VRIRGEHKAKIIWSILDWKILRPTLKNVLRIAVLKSKGTDFDKDFICSAHWSKGELQNIDDLPNLACFYRHKSDQKK